VPAPRVFDSFDEEVEVEDFGGGDGAEDGRRGGFRLDSWALGGTVASTCAVALLGVAEAPLYLLALPVVLPMVALLSYRERTKRIHKLELSQALREQREVNSKVGLLLGRTENSSTTLESSVTELSRQLARVEAQLEASSDATKATHEATKRAFNQLFRMTNASASRILEEQGKTVRQIVAEEVGQGFDRAREGDEAAATFVEVNLLDVKRELAELEGIQTDMVRLVEGLARAQAPGSVVGGAGADEDWIRDELAAVREAIALDVEDILTRREGDGRAEGDAGAATFRLEERLSEIVQAAERNQKSIQDVQDALYSTVGQLAEAEDPGSVVGQEDMLDEVRRVSSSVEVLAASLEALRDLPDAMEDVREAVRDQTEIGSALMSGGGVFTNTQEAYRSTTSVSVNDSSAAIEGLERKIDDLARYTEVVARVSEQLSEIGPGLALPEAGEETATVEEALMSAGAADEAGEKNPSWLEYDQGGELEAVEEVVEAASANAEPTSEMKAPPAEEEPPTPEPATSEQQQEGERDLLAEGLASLRLGRQAESDAEAESHFSRAMECFGEATRMDPSSVAAQGNMGNALLCSARRKIKVLGTFAREARDGAYVSEESVRMSEDVAVEAGEILVRSGRCYRAVLSLNPRDARALLNWGNALCLRAKLVERRDADSAVELYDAAIEKFSASLQLQPDLVEGRRALDRATQSLNGLLY